ncbi:MAG: hypothetical protein AB7O52_18645 [Planctomycetota bacterium]
MRHVAIARLLAATHPIVLVALFALPSTAWTPRALHAAGDDETTPPPRNSKQISADVAHVLRANQQEYSALVKIRHGFFARLAPGDEKKWASVTLDGSPSTIGQYLDQVMNEKTGLHQALAKTYANPRTREENNQAVLEAYDTALASARAEKSKFRGGYLPEVDHILGALDNYKRRLLEAADKTRPFVKVDRKRSTAVMEIAERMEKAVLDVVGQEETQQFFTSKVVAGGLEHLVFKLDADKALQALKDLKQRAFGKGDDSRALTALREATTETAHRDPVNARFETVCQRLRASLQQALEEVEKAAGLRQ